MRETLEQPGMIRYIVVLLVGLPVALIVSGMHPDRQGEGFVPFFLMLAAALAVVWAIGVLVERAWLSRVTARSRGDRGRRR
jgi:hypothetical protein